MGAVSHNYPAHDNQWLKAAGFDPDKHPGHETLLDYFVSKTGLESPDLFPCGKGRRVWNDLNYDGWMDVTRHFTLEERFKLFGVEIENDEKETEEDYYYISYSPRTITLSNGMVLKEVRDLYVEEAMFEDDPEHEGYRRYKLEYGFETGYDFVSVYKVERVGGT